MAGVYSILSAVPERPSAPLRLASFIFRSKSLSAVALQCQVAALCQEAFEVGDTEHVCNRLLLVGLSGVIGLTYLIPDPVAEVIGPSLLFSATSIQPTMKPVVVHYFRKFRTQDLLIGFAIAKCGLIDVFSRNKLADKVSASFPDALLKQRWFPQGVVLVKMDQLMGDYIREVPDVRLHFYPYNQPAFRRRAPAVKSAYYEVGSWEDRRRVKLFEFRIDVTDFPAVLLHLVRAFPDLFIVSLPLSDSLFEVSGAFNSVWNKGLQPGTSVFEVAAKRISSPAVGRIERFPETGDIGGYELCFERVRLKRLPAEGKTTKQQE